MDDKKRNISFSGKSFIDYGSDYICYTDSIDIFYYIKLKNLLTLFITIYAYLIYVYKYMCKENQ